MQGGSSEKEKPDAFVSKVTIKNKITSHGTSNQPKAKRDAKEVRQGTDSQMASVSRSLTNLGTKTTGSNHLIEKQGTRGKGKGISSRQHVGITSSKTLVRSIGISDRGVTHTRVSAPKENISTINKKPAERSTAAPLKTVASSLSKSSSSHYNRTVDKKDQNVKFKGGGHSNVTRSNPSSKSAPRSKDVALKPSVSRETKERTSNVNIRSEPNGVNTVKKKYELMEKGSGKKQNASIAEPALKAKTTENSGSRLKENLKNIMSRHVKKSKVDQSSQLKTSVAGSSVSAKPCENVVNVEDSDIKGRERTRTWTISSSSTDNNVAECASNTYTTTSKNYIKNCDSTVLELKSQNGGVGPDAERTVESIRKYTDSAMKNSTEPNKIIPTVEQSDDDNISKSSKKELNALVKENVEEQPVNYSSDILEGYDYEDDFEEYESDFEEYTDDDDDDENVNGDEISVISSNKSEHSGSESDESHEREDEDAGEGIEVKGVLNEGAEASAVKEEEEDGERKMDSGLYDSGRRKRLEDDFPPLKLPRVDADEGFDEREEGAGAAIEELEVPRGKGIKPIPFCIKCDVVFTKKAQLGKEVLKKTRERGRKLLQMITLDEISYSLFELPPIPYDAFMKCRGHLNTKQSSTQTNEDSHSEGTQTDSIPMLDSWTQKPPVICLSAKENTESFPLLLDNASWTCLGRFMESAGEVMTILLEENWNNSGSFRPEGNSQSSPFSKLSMKLGESGSSDSSWKSLITSRPVTSVCFCKTQSNLLLCCHGPTMNVLGNSRIQATEHNGNGVEVGTQSSLLSIWSVSEPSCPYKLMSCQGYVARGCFQEEINSYGQLLFAGCEDGSISVWDMCEKGGCCVDIPFPRGGFEKALCPMFTTHGDETHLGRIVGLEPILDSQFGDEDREAMHSNRGKITNQVCSLDEWGVVVVWSIIMRGGNQRTGRVSLVASMKVCLGEINWNATENALHEDCENFQDDRISSGVDDVSLWNALAVDCDWILAASDTGSVVCLPVDGEQRSMRVHPGPKESFSSAESIAINPQGLPYFMVGNFIGKVHLYCHSSMRHFGSWEPPSSSLPSAIVKLAWSPQRPFVFFTVDSLSRMDIWDLASSDIFPFATIPPPKVGKITDISLSFPRGNSLAYMAIGMDNGEVVLHQLKEELTNKGHEIRRKELSQFIKYANLL